MNWSYVAGFIDADGSLGLLKKSQKDKYTLYQPRIQISQTNHAILSKIQSFIDHGGHISKNGKTKAGNQFYSLSYRSLADMKYILPQLLPRLEMKKQQAQGLLDWTVRRTSTGPVPYTEEDLVIVERVRNLNLVGRDLSLIGSILTDQ